MCRSLALIFFVVAAAAPDGTSWHQQHRRRLSPSPGKKGMGAQKKDLLLRRRKGGYVSSAQQQQQATGLAAAQRVQEEATTTTTLPESSETRLAHSWSLVETVEKMSTDVEQGLSSEQVDKRRETWGRNELVEGPRKSKWSMLLDQFDDRLVQILVAVAVASAGLGMMENDDPTGWVDPVVICLILVLNAAVGVWQEASADDSLDALKKLQPELCCCKRNGEWEGELSAAELVPGDVVYLRVGDKVPADVRLMQFKASSFSTDEAALTGEAATVQKSTCKARDPDTPLSQRFSIAYAGTVVTAGHAVGVVVATGMSTEIGRIQAGVTAAKADRQKTPLGVKLDEFAGQLTFVIGAVCAATFLASIPRFGAPIFGGKYYKGAIFYAKSAVALGVAAIPEGLPAVITLCLSLGTRRMAARRVVVRRLPSVETLGCTTVICSDKTGTLTTNQMTATALLTPGQKVDTDVEIEPAAPVERTVTGSGYDPTDGSVLSRDEDTDVSVDASVVDCSAVCAMCNDARLTRDEGTGAFARVGEPTEAALKVLCEKIGIPAAVFADSPSSPSTPSWRKASDAWTLHGYERVATLEFDRARKSMSVLVRPKRRLLEEGNVPNSPRLLVKGAPDSVLKRCVAVRDPVSGVSRKLSNAERRLWQARCAEMASRPLRCLALATRDDLPEDLDDYGRGATKKLPDSLKDAASHELVESGLTLVGVVGIRDPPRPEAKAAIQRCRDAGIRVFMITGDSRETAVAIGNELGIIDASTSRAFEGNSFFKDGTGYDDDARAAILAPDMGNAVFCRTAPADKQRIIKLLADYHGDVTAMTGDGVNDAPALQQAAIGIAMGITGTEVAKEAADMVLVDDDFASIVSAVEEGRTIYKNMQSFVCFLLSCNFGEVATVFGATLLGIPDVLSPLQLLWVNLVTDGPPATALGFNPPDSQAMSQPPRRTDESLLTPWFLFRYAATGAYVGLATIYVYVNHFVQAGIPFSAMTKWASCDTTAPFWSEFAPQVSVPTDLDACAVAFSSHGVLKPEAQTLALTTLVAMEMLKALSAVSLDNSLLKVPFWKNKYLCAGVALPICLQMALLYTPAIRDLFGLTQVSADDWKTIALAALPIILVEEVLKAVGRHLDERKKAAAADDKETETN